MPAFSIQTANVFRPWYGDAPAIIRTRMNRLLDREPLHAVLDFLQLRRVLDARVERVPLPDDLLEERERDRARVVERARRGLREAVRSVGFDELGHVRQARGLAHLPRQGGE